MKDKIKAEPTARQEIEALKRQVAELQRQNEKLNSSSVDMLVRGAARRQKALAGVINIETAPLHAAKSGHSKETQAKILENIN